MSDATGGGLIRGLEDDGLYTPSIKEHTLRKIRLHNYYVSIFSTAMKTPWPQRAYIGLYSGAGRATVEETGEIVATTALSAIQMPDPFTKYIFVDNNPDCISALETRIDRLGGDHDVRYIQEDVTRAVPKIIKAMPSYSRPAAFCRSALSTHSPPSWISPFSNSWVGDTRWISSCFSCSGET